MMTEALVQKFLSQVTVTPSTYPGTQHPFSFSASPTFTNVKNTVVKMGTYTPNDDYLYLAQSIAADVAPNFILLFCSSVLNLTIAAGGGYMCSALPIHKVYTLLMPPKTNYLVNGIYIEGRLANIAPAPMAQGVPVDYAFMAGQATLL